MSRVSKILMLFKNMKELHPKPESTFSESQFSINNHNDISNNRIRNYLKSVKIELLSIKPQSFTTDDQNKSHKDKRSSFSIESESASSIAAADVHLSSVESIYQKLQVVKEIEIITNSDILLRYNHVWQNAHWFNDVQLIYPSSGIENSARNQL